MKRSKKESRARGTQLHALRTSLGLSLVELAELSGVSFSMIARAERGNRNLSRKAQERIERACTAEAERQRKKKELDNRLDAAECEVAKCQLAIYRNGLPVAESNLEAVRSEAKAVFTEKEFEAIKNRNVISLLEDYKNVIEQMKIDAESWIQTILQVSVLWHEAIEAQRRGTPFPGHENAVELHDEALRELNENGKIAMPEGTISETIQRIKETLSEEMSAKP